MSLKFKRNVPLVLMLVSLLSILALTMGNQPIASYTVDTQAVQTAQLAIILDGLVDFTSLFSVQSAAGALGATRNSIQP